MVQPDLLLDPRGTDSSTTTLLVDQPDIPLDLRCTRINWLRITVLQNNTALGRYA